MADIEDDDSCDGSPYDHIAARVDAVAALAKILSEIKDDDELRKEGLAMMRAVRLSFKTLSQAEVRTIQGGKTDAI